MLDAPTSWDIMAGAYYDSPAEQKCWGGCQVLLSSDAVGLMLLSIPCDQAKCAVAVTDCL